MQISILISLILLILITLAKFLVPLLLKGYIDSLFKKNNDEFLENLKWESKVREQAARVAEYLALARDLKAEDSRELYRKANQLAWELAMWLPEDVYKSIEPALCSPNSEINFFSIILDIRKILLGEKAGNLNCAEHAILHSPNIGKT